ncbi:TPA: hypothetical protein PNO53_002446 [Salmonella enterica]|nr:hypothetical protein [Salmonella enterica]
MRDINRFDKITENNFEQRDSVGPKDERLQSKWALVMEILQARFMADKSR